MSLCNEKSESWSDKQLRGELCAEFTQTPTIVQGEEINDSTKISHRTSTEALLSMLCFPMECLTPDQVLSPGSANRLTATEVCFVL